MLTKKQHELLLFLQERISQSGVTPSFEEMKNKVGLKSKSGIHRLISALEDRGFIKKLPFKARAIEILKSPNIRSKPLDHKSNIIEKTRFLIQYKNNIFEVDEFHADNTGLIIAEIEYCGFV